MGMPDPNRSFSGDSFENLLDFDPAGQSRAGARQTLARLWRISAAIFPRPGGRPAIRRLGFMLLVLPHLKRLGRWLDCPGNPALSAEMRASPLVFRAIHRPYVNKNWRLVQRLEAIGQHYLSLLERGSLLDIEAGEYFDLLQLGPDYLDLRVVVDRPRWMRGEGEVALSLFYRDHRVYSAMFLITGEAGCRRLVIGAFQGWSSAEAKETYVRLTHALHGMRPRDFLLQVVKMVARSLGCSELWGVADASYRGRHALVRSAKRISYDEVWLEHGGRPAGDGFFVMPAELRLKDAAEVPSRKRAQYRRRNDFLAELDARIEAVFRSGERHVQQHRRGSGGS